MLLFVTRVLERRRGFITIASLTFLFFCNVYVRSSDEAIYPDRVKFVPPKNNPVEDNMINPYPLKVDRENPIFCLILFFVLSTTSLSAF